MILENLKNFEWLNEPENVIFTDKEMKIIAKPQTDFWQSLHHNFAKDDGHFFFLPQQNNFEVIILWRASKTSNFNQCGLMVRFNDKNWFKASLMHQNKNLPEIGSCVTIDGHSDWAGVMLDTCPNKIWYKLIRKDNDFIAYYSLDGTKFIRLRQFYIDTDNTAIKVGAYICSPQDSSFEATLEEISFTN